MRAAAAVLVLGLVWTMAMPPVGAQTARVVSPPAPPDLRRVLDSADVNAIHERPELWERVVRRLRAGTMPPSGSPRPDAATAAAAVDGIASALDRAAAAKPNPGHRLPQRLNRAEYANAIRDLVGLEIDAAALLPPDDASADGFDNNAALLGVSPALLERYLAAAARISAMALGSPAIRAGSETYRIRGDASQSDRHEDLPFGTPGGLMATHPFPLDGEDVIKVKLLEIRLLLEHGADANRRLRNQTTALMIAVSRAGRAAGPEQRTIDTVHALAAGGADLNAANDAGETALHIAVSRGDGLVRALGERGARLDVRDASGRTSSLDVANGVPAAPAAGRGRGGRGAPAGPPPAPRPTTVTLLQELAARP